MGMPAPLWYLCTHPGLERSLWARSEFSSRGLVKFLTAICTLPHLWHHDLPWPLFHISLIYQQCLPFLEGLWIHIPHAYTPWICEASSEDPLGSWTFPLCKLLATSWADWLQGVWGFCEGIHKQECVNGVKRNLLAPVDSTAPLACSCFLYETWLKEAELQDIIPNSSWDA